MAQFVKLKDYLSRYEKDPLYYSSEFPRLKKQFWQATCTRWVERDRSEMVIFDMNIEEEMNFLHRLKEKLYYPLSVLPWRRKTDDPLEMEEEIEENSLYIISDEIIEQIENERDLKKVYLDELLKIQLRWVNSGESIFTKRLSKKYLYDERLRYFIQKFPDHYFYFHDPIFKIKKAPVELSPILLGPAAAYCITYMERREASVLVGSREKFWVEKYKDQETRILNPLFHLQRSANIVRTLIAEKDFPVYKIILCPYSYVDYDDLSADTIIVDIRVYDEWLEKMRTFPIPVKFTQIRVLQNLLSYTAIRKGTKIESDQEYMEHEEEKHLHEIKEYPRMPDEEETDESLILNYREVKELEEMEKLPEQEALTQQMLNREMEEDSFPSHGRKK